MPLWCEHCFKQQIEFALDYFILYLAYPLLGQIINCQHSNQSEAVYFQKVEVMPIVGKAQEQDLQFIVDLGIINQKFAVR